MERRLAAAAGPGDGGSEGGGGVGVAEAEWWDVAGECFAHRGELDAEAVGIVFDSAAPLQSGGEADLIDRTFGDSG